MRGIEGREDIAELIVRRRAITKRPEPPQQVELAVAEAGDIDEALRPGQHREQSQQQHLGERISDLAALVESGNLLK